MATTAGSNSAMAPAKSSRGRASALTVVPMNASEAVQNGDVLVADGTTKDLAVSNTATGAIIGVAVGGGTSVATVDRDAQPGADLSGNEHVLNIALALPGTVFAGNMVENGTPNDHTGVYADDLRRTCDIEESTQGFACLADLTASVVAVTLAYVSPQMLASTSTWQHGRSAGVNILNPRMEFAFLTGDTIFG